MANSTPDPWVVDWLTAERLSPYLAAGGGSSAAAVELYRWNGRIAMAVFRDLADLEILVRNAYDRAICERSKADWLRDPAFAAVAPRHRNGRDQNAGAREARERARRDAGGPTAPRGKTIANLSFGFWAGHTKRRHEHGVWTPFLRRAFVSSTARGAVHDRMEQLRVLRNRIAHHEPLLERDLSADHDALLELCGWISAPVAVHIRDTTDTPRLLAADPR